MAVSARPKSIDLFKKLATSVQEESEPKHPSLEGPQIFPATQSNGNRDRCIRGFGQEDQRIGFDQTPTCWVGGGEDYAEWT